MRRYIIGDTEIVDPDFFAGALAPKRFAVLTIDVGTNEPLWVEDFDTWEEALASIPTGAEFETQLKED